MKTAIRNKAGRPRKNDRGQVKDITMTLRVSAGFHDQLDRIRQFIESKLGMPVSKSMVMNKLCQEAMDELEAKNEEAMDEFDVSGAPTSKALRENLLSGDVEPESCLLGPADEGYPAEIASSIGDCCALELENHVEYICRTLNFDYPETLSIHRYLARAFARLGRLDEATMAYGAALRLTPYDVELVFEYFRVCLAASEPELVREYLNLNFSEFAAEDQEELVGYILQGFGMGLFVEHEFTSEILARVESFKGGIE